MHLEPDREHAPGGDGGGNGGGGGGSDGGGSAWDCEFCKFTSGSFDAVVDHEKSCSSNPEVVAAAKVNAGVAATTEAKAKAKTEASWSEERPLGEVLEVSTALVHHILRTW